MWKLAVAMRNTLCVLHFELKMTESLRKWQKGKCIGKAIRHFCYTLSCSSNGTIKEDDLMKYENVIRQIE
jgi:hypothetical protein